jgi:hypothetical protein
VAEAKTQDPKAGAAPENKPEAPKPESPKPTAAKKADRIAKTRIRHDGKLYQPGDAVPLKADALEALDKAGALEPEKK